VVSRAENLIRPRTSCGYREEVLSSPSFSDARNGPSCLPGTVVGGHDSQASIKGRVFANSVSRACAPGGSSPRRLWGDWCIPCSPQKLLFVANTRSAAAGDRSNGVSRCGDHVGRVAWRLDENNSACVCRHCSATLRRNSPCSQTEAAQGGRARGRASSGPRILLRRFSYASFRHVF
jgi:hypothetical protein